MKTIKVLAIAVLGFIFFLTLSCENKQPKKNTSIAILPQNALIKIGNLTFDTINIVDHKGIKHGIWLTEKDTTFYKNDTAYKITPYNTEEILKLLKK